MAFVAWFAGGWGLIGALRVMGMPRDGLLVLAYLLGIGLVCFAGTMFPFMNAFAKTLGQSYPVMQVSWARFFEIGRAHV